MKERILSNQAIKNWRQGWPGNVSTYTEGLPITPIPRSNAREVCGKGLGTRLPITPILRSNPSGLGMRTELSTSPLPQPHPVLQLCYRSKSSHGRPGSTSRAGGQDVCDYQAFSVYHGSPREETVLLGMGDRGKTVISR